MSAILSNNKITAVNFHKVRGVQAWGLNELIPDAHSGGAPGSESSTGQSANAYRNIDKVEPCFVTKSSCYTHEKAHWVNAVQSNADVKKAVEDLLKNDLRLVYQTFSLDNTVNISNLDRTLHAALDKYAFFAITGSFDTLKDLIAMLKADNERRQSVFDEDGVDPIRKLDFRHPKFLDPHYELVALRPEHMLPDGKVLITYSRDANGQVVSHKTYVPGPDHTLRESPGDLTCSRFPSFPFGYPRSKGPLNPFLVILNAEIKFRRYLRQTQPPPLPLPADVMSLINLTIYLIELIYWKPVIQPDTPAARLFLTYGSVTDPNQDSQSMSEPSDADMGYLSDDNEDQILTIRAQPYGEIRRPGYDATLEDRRNYGQHLLSGRGNTVILQRSPLAISELDHLMLDLPFDADDQRLLEELAQADREKDHRHTQHDVFCQKADVQAWCDAVLTM